MNTILKATAAAAILAAGTASAGDTGTGQLVWECSRAGAPTHDELRESFGIANPHLASQTRIRLASRLAGACQRGVERVVLVEDKQSSIEAVRLARR